MKKYFILTMVLFLSSCASQLELEERAALRDKVDQEECVSLGFIEGTEAYSDTLTGGKPFKLSGQYHPP